MASSSEALAVVAEKEEATATRARRKVVVRKLCMMIVVGLGVQVERLEWEKNDANGERIRRELWRKGVNERRTEYES
jgi:hypothetical protein